MAVVVSEWSAGFDGEFTTRNTGRTKQWNMVREITVCCFHVIMTDAS